MKQPLGSGGQGCNQVNRLVWLLVVDSWDVDNQKLKKGLKY